MLCDLAHHDPADRFLVATAKVYDLTFVTAGERLRNVPGVKVLPNRQDFYWCPFTARNRQANTETNA